MRFQTYHSLTDQVFAIAHALRSESEQPGQDREIAENIRDIASYIEAHGEDLREVLSMAEEDDTDASNAG